jgi:hypothetical protein
LHGLARARVAPGAGFAALHGKGAKTAQLHPLAPRQRHGHLVEQHGDDALNLGHGQMRIFLRQRGDQFGTCHKAPPTPRHDAKTARMGQ